MSKPYFTKWIAVEGEIKEGDKYLDTRSNQILDAILPEGWSNPHTSYWDGPMYKKVKLFICTREIKVGDEIFVPKWYMGDHELYKSDKAIVTSISSPQKGGLMIHYRVESLLGGHIHSGIPLSDTFKVMGEISPEVRFVKEGDEFSEDEVAFVYEPGEDMDTEFIPIPEKSKHHSKKYLTHITVKCRCCGKFVN